MKPTRSRSAGLLAVTVTGALVLSACGGSSDEAASSEGGVNLDVSLFGTMGFEEAGLLDQYQEENEGVTISYESTQDEADYWTALQTRLSAGDAPDVVGLEVGRIAAVAQNQGDRFVDLSTDYSDQLSQYLDWKVDAATTEDGRVVGMGTDTGPMALCYRTDLLEEAGLPTDRDELAAQMTSWQDYVSLGEQFQASAPEGVSWTDSASGLYNAVVSTEETIYYDEAGASVWDTNPAVRSAFDLAGQAAGAGLTARLMQFSPEWNQAFAGSSFATIACPAWMLGYIRGQAGEDGAGLWDVVSLPGGQGGNWGGSYLAIPEDAPNAEAAADLVAWLTAPEQQVTLFEELGNFPSNTEAIAEVSDVTDDYFNGAPTGELFGTAAEAAPVQLLGVNDGIYRTQLSEALTSVENNDVPVDDAWTAGGRGIENQAVD